MEYYFQQISDHTGFQIDQVRYLILLLCSFPLAYVYRAILTPNSVPLVVRHVFSALFGLLFICVCFKRWEVVVIIGFVVISYLILAVLPPTISHWYTMVFAFSSIVIAHTYRMITDYGGWHQDMTSPLMLLVERVTSVACAVHDGLGRKSSELTEYQQSQKITHIPSSLSYMSYNLNFMSVLAGPIYSYKDYTDLVNGDNLKPLDNPNKYARAKEHSHAPSPFYPALMKTLQAFMFGVLSVALIRFTPDRALDPAHYLPVRMVFVFLAAFRVRCLYYFVFIITDAISNTAGLGFNGYDRAGNAKWDLVTNVDPLGLELGVNLRQQVNSWNIGTVKWLKLCVYDRLPYHPTVLTWAISALWHGLYPGYYCAFLVFALANLTARKVRKIYWKRYQNPRWVKIMYDIVTISATSLGRDFAALPFILLTFEKTLILYKSFYFIPFIMCLGLYVFLPDSADGGRDKVLKQNGTKKSSIINEDRGGGVVTANGLIEQLPKKIN